MQIQFLSDDELLAHVKKLSAEETSLLARILLVLIEVDARKLYRNVACSSLFDFCERHLGLSRDEAYRRMKAARLVKGFPRLLSKVDSGELNLTTLLLMHDHLTPTNHE